jgi:hypothetical protein
LLHCVTTAADNLAKSLILLACLDCRESVQGVRKQDRTSVFGRARRFAHKVFHSRGGERQKRSRIKNLTAEAERRVKFVAAGSRGSGGHV